MKKLSLIFKQKSSFWFLGIILVFIFTRIYNILALPIFTDEAIYVRWAQIAGTDANWRFISLTDGKQPLYIWAAAALMRFISDPLLAGRLVSVLSGAATAIGIYFLAKELFKDKSIALISSLMYVLSPFALIYDKLALYDSLLASLAVWSLYFEVLLVRLRRLDIAFVTAMVVGLGLLNKSSAFFFIYLLPFSLLLFDFKQKKIKKELLKWTGFALIVSLLASVYYSVLRLSPFFHIISEKNNVFVYPVKEWISHPFTFFAGNLNGLFGWIVDYLTIPVVLLVAISFFINKNFFREKLLLFSWFIFPFVALALFGKVIYPRFIFFMTMPLLILAAFGLKSILTKVKKSDLKLLVFLAFLSLMAGKDYLILTDFSKAPIPFADRGQLIEGWPSGVGVKETINFLEERAKTEKIYVGTQGTFGLMPFALEIYLKDNPNIKTKAFWPIEDNPEQEVLESAEKIPTYFVFYQPCVPCQGIGIAPKTWPVKEVFQIKKLAPDTYYTLYEIKKD